MTDVPHIASQTKTPASASFAETERNVLTAAKGGGIAFGGTLVAYAVRVVMGIVLGRSLGPEQFGLYSLALTAATTAGGLALVGLPSALVRYVSLFKSKRDDEGIWGTLQVGIAFATVVSVLLGIGMYAWADLVAEWAFHDPRLALPLRLASMMIPFLTLIDVLAAATRGFNKMQYTAIAKNMSQPVIKLFLVGVLAIGGLSTAKALTAHLVSVFIAFVMLLYFLNRLFSLNRPVRDGRRETKKMFVFAFPLYLEYLIGTFRNNLQTILLGALNTVTTVGVFTAASQVNMIGQMFHQSIVTTSMPIVSALHDKGELENLARFYQTMTKWTFTLNLPLFLTTLLFAEPILSIFGKDFAQGALALTILACGNLVNTGTGICGVIINMTGNTIFNLVNSIVLSAIMLGLNILLIPRWGVAGASTATMAAVATVNLLRLSEVFYLFRVVPYNASFIKPIAAGLVTLVVTWVTRQAFHTEAHLVYTAINVALLFAVYAGLVLLLGLSQEDRAVLAQISRRVSAALHR
jgi:O-antigen/teichoic acid export membrane protein